MQVSFKSANSLIHLTRIDELSLFLLIDSVEDDEWANMLNWSHANLIGCKGTLAYQPRGGVTPKQRQMAATQGRTDAKRICLLSDSAIVRGTLTAYAWIRKYSGTEYAAYAPADMERGIKWLAEEVRFDAEQTRAVVAQYIVLANQGIRKASGI